MCFGNSDNIMQEEKKFRVLQINTGIKDSSIPFRLMNAFAKIGISSYILAMDSEVMDKRILLAKKKLMFRFARKLDLFLAKTEEKLFYNSSRQLPFSFFRVGINLAREPLVKEADVLILHWVCGTYLSSFGMKRILNLGKPTVIVCHDSWQFTGGCHVRLGCEKFKDGCGNCPQLQSGKKYDWSYRLIRMKEKAMKGKVNVCIVSPSYWMDENVARSFLFKKFKHYVIANPIDITKYYSMDKREMRKKWRISEQEFVILFGAVNITSTPYKGYGQLLKALDCLEKKGLADQSIVVYGFGTTDEDRRKERNIRIKFLGNILGTQMMEIYSCADIYVMPSLDDNLPGTVMESLACEVPVVAFRTGGIPDMVLHKENGYLAEYNNPDDLAEGIKWVMEHNPDNVLGMNGRRHVIQFFSEEIVANKYKDLLLSLLKK